MKMVIVDRELAILPAPGDGPGTRSGSALVRPSPLLDGLIALFEQFWATGLPLTPSPVHAAPRRRNCPSRTGSCSSCCSAE